MRTLVATVVRGLRARLLLSVGSVLLVALAVGSAVLGPVFQVAVTNSYLVTRLAEAPNALTGLSWVHTPAPGTGPAEAAADAVALAEQAGAGAGGAYVAPQTFVRTDETPGLGGLVRLATKDGYCEHLEVEGRCPAGPREVLMLAGDAGLTDFSVGSTFDVGGAGTLEVVGLYRVPGPEEADWWFDLSRFSSRTPTPPPSNQPYRPAPLLTGPETFEQLSGVGFEVLVDRRLEPPADLDLEGLDEVRAVAAAQDDLAALDLDVRRGGFETRSINDVDGVAAEVRAQQETARSSVAPAVLSLVLVALALLLRLLTAAADLRLPELALASLRGLPRRRMWSLGLSEPLVLLGAAVPAGAALGLGVSWLLVEAWLVPGLPVPLPWSSAVAGLGVGLGAALVAVVAVGLVLRVDLAAQLSGVRRPVRARRGAVLAQLALVAAALVVLLSKLSSTGPGEPDVTDLVLPVLLAVVAGLGGARGTAALAGWWTRRGPRDTSLSTFVASRALSRRREGTLVILPVTAAIAICVFGAGVYDSAGQWRASVAATRAPAAVVWASDLSLDRTVALSRAADPEGRWLMAAGTLSSTGPVFTVADTSRLERVAQWSDQWTPGTSPGEIADRLRPRGVVPVLEGARIGVEVDNRARSGDDLVLRLRLVTAEGEVRFAFLPVSPGTGTTETRVGACRDGCRLEGLTVGGPAALRTTVEGTIEVRDVLVDGEPVEGAVTGAGWGVSPDASAPEAVTRLSDEGGVLRIEAAAEEPAILQLTAGDLPAALPVVKGVDARTEPDPNAFSTSSPLSFPVDPVVEAASVPLLGPRGLLIDYETVSIDREVYDQDSSEVVVLARADTPGPVVDELRAAGLVVDRTYAEVREGLDGEAYALALRLYAVVAVLVLVMAVAALGVSTAVQLPARRSDAASLRVVGVSRREVVRAVLLELSVVLGSTAVAGLAAGALAQYVVLRTVTLGYAETLSTPALVAGIDPARLALLALVTAVLFGAVAVTSAMLTVRGARGATLRENAR